VPKGSRSLKVLSECPLSTVMMYQMHKTQLQQDINEIINIISNVIILEPTFHEKENQELKEVLADFVTVQVRALSFVVYFKNNKVIYSDCY
jgi:hypothetical protein